MMTTQLQTTLDADQSKAVEPPVADLTKTFSNLAQQCAPAALAANDDVAPGTVAESTSTAINTKTAKVSVSAEMGRDRALTLNTIGPRLFAARVLNGIPQTETARLAGMSNSTQLSLYEQGRRAPPLYALLAIAKTLSVSMDFLFGLSEDPERDARAARRNSCVRAVHSMLTKTAETIADGFEASDRLAGPDASNVRELLDAGSALTAAMERYHQLNVEQFEDSPGGATVLGALSRMAQVQLNVRDVLRRHDAFAEHMRMQIAAIGPLGGDEEVEHKGGYARLDGQGDGGHV